MNQRAYENLNIGEFQPCVLPAQILLLPNLPGAYGFFARLPPMLAGGSTFNSSQQLQPNESGSSIQVNSCRAAQLPSLADLESLRAMKPLLGRGIVSPSRAWTPLPGSVLQPT